MDLTSLNLFIRVMHRRSFAAAGRELNVSASTVSRSIAALEEKLGVKLFQRTTRQVSPTEAAVSYFQSIEPLIRELEQANVQAANLVSRPQGTLRVACPVSFADSILARMLPDFSKCYPELAIELIASNSSHDFYTERIDVAVRYGQLRDSSLVALKLSPLKELICAAPEYLQRCGNLRSPADLQKRSCLLFLLPGYPLSWRLRKSAGTEIIVPLSGHFRSSHAHVLKKCALNGMGITLLPEFSLQKELSEGSLVPVLDDYEATATQFGSCIWLVYVSRDYLPLRARVFIDALKNYMSGLD